jgi:hypothetical protein
MIDGDPFDGIGDLFEFVGEAGGKIIELAADGAGAIAEGTAAAASAVAEASSTIASAVNDAVEATGPMLSSISDAARGAVDYALGSAAGPHSPAGDGIVESILELPDIATTTGDPLITSAKQPKPRGESRRRRRRRERRPRR